MKAMDRPGGEDILPTSKKTRALLAYLCFSEGARLPRGHLAGLIWETAAERQARDNLRHSLAELERVGAWKIESNLETVRLDTTHCWIDAFETPGDSEILLRDLYGGISNEFDRWLLRERSRFENRWQVRLETKLHDAEEQNALPDLRINAARELLNFIPNHESAVRSLMIAFADRGDPLLAIREYERFRILIGKDEMLPAAKTVALYESIRRGPVGNAFRNRQADEIKAAATTDGGVFSLITTGRGDGPPAHPSIAVLPLRNLSGDVVHDYIAEGLVEDLSEGLARVPTVSVISRYSAAAFRHQERPPQEIGDALGVQYVLSGSIRVVGDDLRLNMELADTRTGMAIWHNRYDEKAFDLLELQHRLAEAVARSVAPRIHHTELNRVHIKRPDDYDAYDLFLRAQENMHSPSRETFEAAGALFRAAIERERHYATAMAWFAHWHVLRVGQGWSSDPAEDTARAEHFARHAVECDGNEPMALAIQGHIAGYLHRDFDLARARFDLALRINPNSSRAWLWSSYRHAWVGEGPDAVTNVNKAMALSPYDPLESAYSGAASVAYLANQQYNRAIEFALRCIGENRGYTTAYKALVLGLSLAGREKEAKTPVNQLLTLEPNFSVEKFRQKSPAGTGEIGALFCDALARAGVPLAN
jgi:TolB-like protein